MFWDIRPTSHKKTNEAKQKTGLSADQPFSYLDLTWKPFLKVRECVKANCMFTAMPPYFHLQSICIQMYYNIVEYDDHNNLSVITGVSEYPRIVEFDQFGTLQGIGL